jgi:hypothetical protein
MVARSGREPLEFGEALLKEQQRLENGGKADRTYYAYMDRARYTKQVERYQKLFPEARFLFVKFEDLIAPDRKGLETYRTICEFIGVKSSPELADRSEKMNPASEPRSIFVQTLLSSESELKRSFKKWVPAPLAGAALRMARWNLRPVPRQAMPSVPEKIVEQARSEIRKLESLTGWDLSDWMVKEFPR